MKEIFHDQEFVGISVDGWSKNSKSFMGYNATFLDQETLERRVVALACRRVKGSHTWDVCANNIAEVLREFNILNSTKMCTTDGASNFQKCFVMCGTQTLVPDTQTQDEDEDMDMDMDLLTDDEDDEDTHAEVRVDPDITPFNIGELFDKTIDDGDLDEGRLPFRIQCQAHYMTTNAIPIRYRFHC